jgi:tetratricopeptide (TPR) repeat protein
VRLARDLFAREMEDDYGTFGGAVALYADVLCEVGLAEYRRLATAAWNKLTPRRGPSRAQHESRSGQYQLQGILDFFAERDGDVDARIALRATDLTSPWSYLQLAEFCLDEGRKDEALRRAEEGLWLFEDDRTDERLVLFAAGLLSKAGRKSDAEAHLWRAFEKAPSFELYARLRKLSGAAGRERAVKVLEARLAKEQGTRWSYPADLLIRILTHEKMFDAAWAAVRDHGASRGIKESLARASESTHRREAVAAYAERIEELVDSGGNPAYAEAAKYIAHVGTLRDGNEQSAYVAGLRARFGRKRNFIKALDAKTERRRGQAVHG